MRNAHAGPALSAELALENKPRTSTTGVHMTSTASQPLRATYTPPFRALTAALPSLIAPTTSPVKRCVLQGADCSVTAISQHLYCGERDSLLVPGAAGAGGAPVSEVGVDAVQRGGVGGSHGEHRPVRQALHRRVQVRHAAAEGVQVHKVKSLRAQERRRRPEGRRPSASVTGSGGIRRTSCRRQMERTPGAEAHPVRTSTSDGGRAAAAAAAREHTRNRPQPSGESLAAPKPRAMVNEEHTEMFGSPSPGAD